MKPSRPHPELLLSLSRTDRHGFTELGAVICYRHQPGVTPGGSSHDPGTVLSPLFNDYGDPRDRYSQYADLHVRASLDTVGDVAGGHAYGWCYEYRPHTVNLTRAQSMATFLRRTDRQMAALAHQMGTPGDFADYLTHFAVALGITRFAEYTDRIRPDGTRWRWMNADQMQAWIRRHEQPVSTPAGR
ncbi:hypothetical protein [Actinoplanes regularis]|uniref:Uncharacterized protein n=1 Tax=Actinoplanes regularis TaxID=52697 RepID=A0A238XHP2_9ACTN|nr:hypothetical protein [Actinoplanes regularis]GIE90477.1 hypothetical protein Are01nite_69570 [Actinoplanes regularis]SNR58447.1 hypothetical protein SAMN06264365_103469 [Actinoplanes regularis]